LIAELIGFFDSISDEFAVGSKRSRQGTNVIHFVRNRRSPATVLRVFSGMLFFV